MIPKAQPDLVLLDIIISNIDLLYNPSEEPDPDEENPPPTDTNIPPHLIVPSILGLMFMCIAGIVFRNTFRGMTS